MDDTILHKDSAVPKLRRPTKYEKLRSPTICEMEETVVKPKPKALKKTGPSLEPVQCLIEGSGLRGRHAVIKSINDREVIATAFTRAGAYRKARRRGLNQCCVIYIPKRFT